MAQMLECHDRSALRGDAALDRRRTTRAPLRRRIVAAQRAFRGAARPGLRGDRGAHPRARHRHPGRPQGRDPRHAAAGAGAAAGAAAGRLARLSGHDRRALHRLPDRRRGRHAARRRRALQREDRAAAALLPAERRAAARCRCRRRAPSGACPTTRFVLCAFHQSYKISAEVFDSWCELLHAAARARCSGCCNGTPTCRPTLDRGGAASAASAPSGCVFAPLLPLQGHLSRLAHADVYPRRLAVQRPHHRRRGALGRRAGGHAARARPSPSASPRACCTRSTSTSWSAATSPPIAATGGRARRRSAAARRAARRICSPQRTASALFDGAALRARHRGALPAHVAARRRRRGARAAAAEGAAESVAGSAEPAQLPRNDGADRAFAAQGAA